MFNSLFSRRPFTLLTLTLVAACGSPGGESDTADTSASASAGTSASGTSMASAETTDDAPTGTGSGTATPTTEPTTTVGEACGNGALDPGEDCDGAELGGQDCAAVDASFGGGTLACGPSCTFDTAGCVLASDVAQVTLNELTSESVLAGPFMGNGDAIELYNAGMKAADMSGWKLSDDETFPALKTYVFPPNSVLEPGAFKVLIARDELTLEGDLPFGINNKEIETVILADAGGNVVDSVMVEGPKALVSLCRLPDGSGPWAQCLQTFGAVNELAATACNNGKLEEAEACDGVDLAGQTCVSLGLGFNGGALSCSVKCNFDAKKCTTDSELVLNELESVQDDIEIYNAGNKTIDLSGWYLTDDRVDKNYDPALDDGEMKFPAGTTLGAKKYMVVHAGPAPGQHPFGLGAGGDTVTLFKPGPIIIDQVTYDADEAAISFCRKPTGPGGAWTAGCAPTMGSAN